MDTPWAFVTGAYAVAYGTFLFYGISLYRRRAKMVRELARKNS